MKIRLHSIISFLFTFIFGCLNLNALGIEKKSLYMQLYSQKIEIAEKNSKLISKSKYKLIFKFEDEKSLSIFKSYSLYHSFWEKIEDIKVFTINPQPDGKNKRIEIKDFITSNSTDKSVFYDDHKEVKINFLGLVIGSEAHIEYTVITEEMHFTDLLFIRSYMPIKELEYEIRVPKKVKLSITEKYTKNGLISYSKEIKKNDEIHIWKATDVDQEKRYDNAPSRTYYSPHIIYKIDEYEQDGRITRVSKTPQDLFNFYVSNIKHINSKPSTLLKELGDAICAGAQSEREKVMKVYDWVKDNIKYVAFEAGYEGIIPREAALVCTNRYGDCKDMSSLQYGLLRALNIPIHMTWIGTRTIPYTYNEVPLMNVDNHMIAAYKDGEKWIFLDATDPSGFYGIPAEHIQGKEAMIYINDSTFELVKVPIVDMKANEINDSISIELVNNQITVNSKSSYHGLVAGAIGNKLLYLTEKEIEQFAKDLAKEISNNAILEKHSISKSKHSSNAQIEINYKIKDYVKEINNELFFNPFLLKPNKNDHIDDVNRNAPVEFKFNVSNLVHYKIKTPANYKVKLVPGNSSFNQQSFGYDLDVTTTNDVINIRFSYYLNFTNLLLMPSEFLLWNSFVKQLNETYNESIIFEKR